MCVVFLTEKRRKNPWIRKSHKCLAKNRELNPSVFHIFLHLSFKCYQMVLSFQKVIMLVISCKQWGLNCLIIWKHWSFKKALPSGNPPKPGGNDAECFNRSFLVWLIQKRMHFSRVELEVILFVFRIRVVTNLMETKWISKVL